MLAEDSPLLKRTIVPLNWNALQLYGLSNTNSEFTLKEDLSLYTLITMPSLGCLPKLTFPPIHALNDGYSCYNHTHSRSNIRKEQSTEMLMHFPELDFNPF